MVAAQAARHRCAGKKNPHGGATPNRRAPRRTNVLDGRRADFAVVAVDAVHLACGEEARFEHDADLRSPLDGPDRLRPSREQLDRARATTLDPRARATVIVRAA